MVQVGTQTRWTLATGEGLRLYGIAVGMGRILPESSVPRSITIRALQDLSHWRICYRFGPLVGVEAFHLTLPQRLFGLPVVELKVCLIIPILHRL